MQEEESGKKKKQASVTEPGSWPYSGFHKETEKYKLKHSCV